MNVVTLGLFYIKNVMTRELGRCGFPAGKTLHTAASVGSNPGIVEVLNESSDQLDRIQ